MAFDAFDAFDASEEVLDIAPEATADEGLEDSLVDAAVEAAESKDISDAAIGDCFAAPLLLLSRLLLKAAAVAEFRDNLDDANEVGALGREEEGVPEMT